MRTWIWHANILVANQSGPKSQWFFYVCTRKQIFFNSCNQLILLALYHIFSHALVTQVSGTLLEENQVRSVVEGVKEVIVASANRRIERTARAKAEDFDSEEEELLREENEQEDEIFDQVSY